MRYSQVREKAALMLLASALPALLSCAENVSGVIDPTETIPAQVVAVAVTVDSMSLTVGHLARAAAIAVDTAGEVITGREVSWTSLTPAVASVSSDGVVSGIAPGSAAIQAAVSDRVGIANVTVVIAPTAPAPAPAPPGAVGHDFNDGTMGQFVNVWEDGGIDFPNDPTGSGRGKVARMHYSTVQGNPGVQSSDDTDIAYNRSASRVRYNETIWMRGELYLPYSGSAINANHNRKLIDYTGAGVGGIHTRVTLHRRDMKLMVSIVDWMGGSLRETISEWSGITLADDTWHQIEVRMKTNSADGIRDGILEIYMNGSSTPAYSRTTGLGWITEAFPGGTFFSYLYIGSQLTVDPNQPVYNEYRYWDNIAFSPNRLGF